MKSGHKQTSNQSRWDNTTKVKGNNVAFKDQVKTVS